MAETFNPNQHMKKLQGKDYLEVKWRLVWMLQATSPRAGYITIELEHSREHGYARYAAIAWDGNDETWRKITMHGVEVQVCGRVGMGTKTENRADFGDFTEKAETGALGRALAGIGFGTQFSPDVEEGARLVDTPIERKAAQALPAGHVEKVTKDVRVIHQAPPPSEKPRIPSDAEHCRMLARNLNYSDDAWGDLCQQYAANGKVDFVAMKAQLMNDAQKASA